jgi:HlyD family secretion protein
MSTRVTRIAWIFACSLLLAGCGSAGGETTPTPELGSLEDFQTVIGATGVVIPERWATLSMRGQGVVAEVLVAEGDSVAAGQALVRLEGRSAAEAQVRSAEYELLHAQQALNELNEQAPVVAAQAELTVANARDALDDAVRLRIYQQKGNRATPETIDGAEAALTLAEESVKRAEAAYTRTTHLPETHPTRAAARAALEAARQQRDAAKRNLNWYKGEPSDIDQAILDAKVGVAQAAMDQAELDAAQLIPGPDPDLLAQAQTRLALAQAQLAAAQEALADLELRAPFAGTVCSLETRVGEWLMAGVPVLQLADLARLQVETTDLNEIDAARIQAGDQAEVTFDALPDISVAGTVQRIGFKSAQGSGVNYTVVLELDSIPEALRWGMTAFVDIEVGE